tara:strand:- start:36 stop:698 length:663 start_codon:yes stop_codon:yes gene_type:complete
MEKFMEKLVNKPYRNELKYILSKQDYFKILKILSSIGFTKYHEPNVVNNVYFDLNKIAFNENVEGYSNRMKCRIRWYGLNMLDNSINLELKIKRGHAGKKIIKRLNTSNFKDLNLIKDEIIKISLKHNLQIENLNPNVQNQYYREYFIKDNSIRLTLDSNIKYFKYNEPQLGEYWSKTYVLEIKFDTKLEPNLDFVSRLGLRLEKNSKYVNGLKLIDSLL